LSRVPGQRSENHELLQVKSDYVRGLWDANHRGPAVVTVRAMNAEEAAMLVYGGPLRKRGKPCEHRAQVWPLGGVRDPSQIEHFYIG
jgi:hypothetical protein